ncbi:MAG: gas vesicle protein GvpN, partial [Trichodesmium sp. MAG_R01]|nr:gas vesicle protein GvpN [Trichodesmium sp. MAG_R01]
GMGQPDISTEQNIVIQKTGINPLKAEVIIKLVRSVRQKVDQEDLGSLRSALMISKVCHDHDIPLGGKDSNFSDLCADILVSRASMPRQEALQQLDEVLGELFPADQLSSSSVGLKKEGSL